MRPSPILIILSAAIAFPTAASASQVSVDQGNALFKSGAQASDVTGHEVMGGITYEDALQPLFVGSGCVTGPPVFCPAGGWDVRLGAGDDRFHGWGYLPMKVVGGAGNDKIHAAGGRTDATGGPGDDDLWVNANEQTRGNGGPGRDRVFGWENGVAIAGGDDDDLVVGDGRILNTAVDGNDGDDVIVGTRSGGNVAGGPGDDVITVPTQNRGISGRGSWTITGGIGDDLIQGGPGQETVNAGDGADTVDVVDGNVDSVACGPGADTVYADVDDTVARNCETVVRGPAPAFPAIDDALARAAQLASEVNG
jgi:Ca2+-binding RTX toxin-like protein